VTNGRTDRRTEGAACSQDTLSVTVAILSSVKNARILYRFRVSPNVHNCVLFMYVLQASLPELAVNESDPGPARLVLYSNLPITCQGVTRTNSPIYCSIRFALSSDEDIAMRQRVPGTSKTTKHMCTYQLYGSDWKPAEQYAYNSNQSLDIVAKVTSFYASTAYNALLLPVFGAHLRFKVSSQPDTS